ALDQRRRDGIDLAARLGVAQAAPASRAVALGEEHPIGLGLDRRAEQAREARIVGGERRARAQVEHAVGATLAGDVRRPIGDRPQGCLLRLRVAYGCGLAHCAASSQDCSDLSRTLTAHGWRGKSPIAPALARRCRSGRSSPKVRYRTPPALTTGPV